MTGLQSDSNTPHDHTNRHTVITLNASVNANVSPILIEQLRGRKYVRRKKEVLVVKEENNFQQEVTVVKTRWICLIYSTCPSGGEPIENLHKRGGSKRTNGQLAVSPGDAARFCPPDKTPANIRLGCVHNTSKTKTQRFPLILNEICDDCRLVPCLKSIRAQLFGCRSLLHAVAAI